jgi:group I intron endonuclease
MFVYLITNTVNNKVYVGKTVRNDLHAYFRHNIANAVRGSKDKRYLYSAIRKYGPESFKIETICKNPSEKLLLAIECFYIKHLRSNDCKKGYNLTRGGDGVSGMKQSEYCKQRVREVHTGRKHSPERREEKRKMLEGNKLRAGISPWNKSKPWSDEARKKMSESARKRWANMTPEEAHKYKIDGRKNAKLRWNSRGK